MKYHNHRAEPYFTFLKNGLKTIEGRVRKGWYADVQVDDEIVVSNVEETDSVEVVVTRVAKYDSIKNMLESEPLKQMLPDVETVEEGIEVYRRFYTAELEAEFGMVSIEVEVVK